MQHDDVKARLFLGKKRKKRSRFGSDLFCGVAQEARDRLSVRSSSHVLVVGDPGLGKSQMLRAAPADRSD